METFVEKDRFKGTCYKAANWVSVGQTQGRGKLGPAGKISVPIKDAKLSGPQALVEILQEMYEEDFPGFSYGARPNRSQHNALNAIFVAVTQRKESWVLDADIRGFYVVYEARF